MSNLRKRAGLTMTSVLAVTLGAMLLAKPATASEDHPTVLTMAPDGAWGAATDVSTNRAIAGAIAHCKAMSQSDIGCGASFTTIRAGWSLGIRCGRENIVVAARTLADAEQAAVTREIELRKFYVSDMPPCRRVVTIDPHGTMTAPQLGKVAALQDAPQSADEGRALANLGGAPQRQQPQQAFVPTTEARTPWRELSLRRQMAWSPKWITLGAFQNVDDLRGALERGRMKIGLAANAILDSQDFTFNTTETEVNLVIASVADLGFGDEGASLTAIHARARTLGLELCPAEIGPQLRLGYLNQPVGEWLHIAMTPIATSDGRFVDFTVANGGAGLLLLGGEARPDRIMPAAIKFVFVLPQPAGNVVARERSRAVQ